MKLGTKSLMLMLLVLLITGMNGCVTPPKPPPKTDYYTLEYDSIKTHLIEPVQSVIRVERFQVAPLYNTTHIVYKEASYKRDAFHYHKWRANPGDLVTYFLARDLRETDLFKGVFILSSKYPASHVIDGTLDRMYQESIDNAWLAVLSVSITFMADYEPDISRRILFQKAYTVKKPCEQKNPRALAAAMSLAMAEISKAVIEDIHHALTHRR